MRKLVVATSNRGKLREISEILEGVPFEVVSLAGWPDVDPPDETGRAFEANARLKALYYAAHTGELTVAEDSGLEIDALGGAPGVESARFGGPASTYPEKFTLLYDALQRTGDRQSRARFVCALALATADRIVFEARGKIEGQISPEPRGSGGFGYDPIFYYPPFGRTLAEAGDRKQTVSHRAQAFRQLRAFLMTDD